MATVTRGDAASRSKAVNAEILDRLPPQNLEAERGVLGSMVLDPNVSDDVALLLRPEDFYSTAHQKLYAHMQQLHADGVRLDPMLLLEQLKLAGDLEAVGGAAYVAEIVQAVPYAVHAAYYAQIVQDKATLRAMIQASTEILRDGYDATFEPKDLVNRAEEKIFAIHNQRDAGEVVNLHDVLLKVFDRINDRLDRPGEISGLETGLSDLDHLLGGLHASELIILAARPSMGKTALAANIAEHVTLKRGIATLFVSLEMSRLELGLRILCSHARVSGHKVRDGFISAIDRKKLMEASAVLSQAPLWIDDTSSRTIMEIAAAARRLKRKGQLGLVVVDYLQLIEPDNPRDQRQEQVAKIARRLKGLARELKVPVLCLAQLNRQAEATKEGHRPRLSHLRESGAIEQDADVVMFVHRESYYQSNEDERAQSAHDAEVIVAKQRNGPTDSVKLVWQPEYTRFETLARRAEEFSEAF